MCACCAPAHLVARYLSCECAERPTRLPRCIFRHSVHACVLAFQESPTCTRDLDRQRPTTPMVNTAPDLLREPCENMRSSGGVRQALPTHRSNARAQARMVGRIPAGNPHPWGLCISHRASARARAHTHTHDTCQHKHAHAHSHPRVLSVDVLTACMQGSARVRTLSTSSPFNTHTHTRFLSARPSVRLFNTHPGALCVDVLIARQSQSRPWLVVPQSKAHRTAHLSLHVRYM